MLMIMRFSKDSANTLDPLHDPNCLRRAKPCILPHGNARTYICLIFAHTLKKTFSDIIYCSVHYIHMHFGFQKSNLGLCVISNAFISLITSKET